MKWISRWTVCVSIPIAFVSVASAQSWERLSDGTAYYRLSDGRVYSGPFKNGLPHGPQGSAIDIKTKDVAVGSWMNGIKDGIFLELSKSGNQKYSIYELGQLRFQTDIRTDISVANGYPENTKVSRWRVYDFRSLESIHFYDYERTARKGSIANVWASTDYRFPIDGGRRAGALSSAINFEYDCNKNVFRVITAYWYSQRQRGGDVLVVEPYERLGHSDSKWHEIPPESAAELLKDRICTR